MKGLAMPREWDAVRYDALPLPHRQWGRRTIDRLDLAGHETVLDAGCGTGRDVEVLLTRLDTGRVIAVDGSRTMLDRLRERLAAALKQAELARVEVVQADLIEPLPIGGPVDAVMSVAAFHWIKDHDVLFANLAAVLRPGGQLSTDCGGAGNVASVAAAVQQVAAQQVAAQEVAGQQVTEEQPSPWNFAGVAETERRLSAAGFTDLDVRLVPDPARFSGTDQLRDYLRTVLGGQLDRLPAEQHEQFVVDVANRLPEPVVDYVRLQITCRR
jgi:trans-aconitate 2-methyltransferase